MNARQRLKGHSASHSQSNHGLPDSLADLVPAVLAVLAVEDTFPAVTDLLGIGNEGVVEDDVEIGNCKGFKWLFHDSTVLSSVLTVVDVNTRPPSQAFTNNASALAVKGSADYGRDLLRVWVGYASLDQRVSGDAIDR